MTRNLEFGQIADRSVLIFMHEIRGKKEFNLGVVMEETLGYGKLEQ